MARNESTLTCVLHRFSHPVLCFITVDGETRICTFSPRTIEFLVKEASKNLEWKELRFLYLGTTANDTSKGIAIKCDASCVPLELLIESDVKDLHRLVSRLLECGALPDGLKGCKRRPLLTAMELMKFPIAVTLLRNKADPSCVIGNEIFINREVSKNLYNR